MSQRENNISYDSVSYLYLSSPVVLIWQLISAFFLSIILLNNSNNYALGILILLSSIVFAYRYYHFYLFKKNNKIEILQNINIWRDRFFLDTLLSGFLWGSMSVLVFPKDPTFQMILVLFLFISSFISMSNLASNFQLLLIYCLITFVPLSLKLLFFETINFSNFGLIVIALMIIMILVSKYFGNIVNISIEEHQNFLDIKHSHEILQERFFSLFERAPVGIVYFDKNLDILDCNSKFMELNNIQDKKLLIGKNLAKNSNQELANNYKIVFKNKIGKYRGPDTSVLNDKKLYLDINTVPLSNTNNEINGGIAILNDITEEISAKEKVIRNAYYDMLTNIPNRTLFIDNLKNAISVAKENNTYSSVLYFDIDNFKTINETYGHQKGDIILKEVAARIQNKIKDDDILARISGDKFTLLIKNLSRDPSQSIELLIPQITKIKSTFLKPFTISFEQLYLTVSIGIYIFPDYTIDENTYNILKCSEIAMYEAKKTGKNSTVFYNKQLGNQISEFSTISRELKNGFKNRELEIYYQPQSNIKTNKINGAEALIRWNHPTKGMIPPNVFIPIAEEDGYIFELTNWVIKQVVSDIKKLIDKSDNFPIHSISININSMHFLSSAFEDEIKSITEHYKVPAKYIELEITEGVVIQNINEAIKKMKLLKKFGFKISMDDFGTGYSSLSYLSKLPFDSLKIDQAFIKNITKNKNNRKLVYSIIELAKNFNMNVIAEGVEDLETLYLLQETECDTYQGFLYHKPMSFNEFQKLII